MTTTSGYSGRLGGRSSHYGPDQTQNARLLGLSGGPKENCEEAAVVAADGPNEIAYDDERQTVYCDVHFDSVDGLSGVIGETQLVPVDVRGEGLMGDKFVGEVTLRDERLSDKAERSIIFSGKALSW